MTFLKILLLGFWNVSAVLSLSLLMTWQLRAWLVPDLSTRSFPANFIFETCSLFGVCSFPTANVSTVVGGKSVIVRGLTHDVWLDLTVFDDAEARTAGMFILVSRCRDRYGSVWHESKRSGTLTFRSAPVHWLRLACKLPWILLGLLKEEETVMLYLLDDLIVRKEECRVLEVEVQNSKLTISRATVRFVPKVNSGSSHSCYELFAGLMQANLAVVESVAACPGDYCGHTVLDASGNLSDCGACPWGTRVDKHGVCVRCKLDPTMYDWLYLSFMAILPFLHHCAFARMTMNRKQLSSRVIGSQILSSAVECTLAALLSLLMVDPFGSLCLRTCGVQRMADWYTVFYNPVINYRETIHCTQEAVYPLYFLPFLYYLLSLAAMIVVRPSLLYAFSVKKDDVSDAIYAALYVYPALIVMHAVFCGLIYFSFPFALLLVAVCLNAVHLALYPEQNARAILKQAWQSKQNLAFAATLLFLYTDAILSIGALPAAWWTYLAFLFLPVPTIFYLLTVKFTDPSNLTKVN
uniref:Seipin n=1 Tax=Trichuris muris TaxID=70415 RepID=A0A5S6R4L4_TRIMR